eukprot:PhF_6_TR27200/c0_g1_i1/m.39980
MTHGSNPLIALELQMCCCVPVRCTSHWLRHVKKKDVRTTWLLFVWNKSHHSLGHTLIQFCRCTLKPKSHGRKRSLRIWAPGHLFVLVLKHMFAMFVKIPRDYVMLVARRLLPQLLEIRHYMTRRSQRL